MIILEIEGKQYRLVLDFSKEEEKDIRVIVGEEDDVVGTWFTTVEEDLVEDKYTAVGLLLKYDIRSYDPVPPFITCNNQKYIDMWDVSYLLPTEDYSPGFEC